MMFGSDINVLIWALKSDQREKLKDLLTQFKAQGIENDDFDLGLVIKDIENTDQYLKKLKLKKEAISKNMTMIPQEEWGVHIGHCCKDHGCKYGDIDCPVIMDLEKQKCPCEDCKIEETSFIG